MSLWGFAEIKITPHAGGLLSKWVTVFGCVVVGHQTEMITLSSVVLFDKYQTVEWGEKTDSYKQPSWDVLFFSVRWLMAWLGPCVGYFNTWFHSLSASCLAYFLFLILLYLTSSPHQLQLWDTAGQERFRKSMVQHYYRNVHAVLFIYDVTRPTSFNGLTAWVEECRQNSLGQEIPRYLHQLSVFMIISPPVNTSHPLTCVYGWTIGKNNLMATIISHIAIMIFFWGGSIS